MNGSGHETNVHVHQCLGNQTASTYEVYDENDEKWWKLQF